jgi:hypothetical protein
VQSPNIPQQSIKKKKKKRKRKKKKKKRKKKEKNFENNATTVTTHKGNCQHAKDPRHAFTSHWFIQKA